MVGRVTGDPAKFRLNSKQARAAAKRGNAASAAKAAGKPGLTVAERSREKRKRERALTSNRRNHLGRNCYTDLFVVETAALAAVIESSPLFMRMRSEETNGVNLPRQKVSARLWLASEIGTTVDVIRRILDPHSTFTGLLMADDILLALSETAAFHDGRLPCYANPRMSRQNWIGRATLAGVVNPDGEWDAHAHPTITGYSDRPKRRAA